MNTENGKTYRPPQQHGLVVLNKPTGPTSAGCLEKIKRRLGQKKIGHAGTLDPLANGVLLVMLGQGTKLAQYLTDGRKTYMGSLTLGLVSDTYDSEGDILEEPGYEGVTEDMVRREIDVWGGTTSQIVPPYSAAKHKGKPLYQLSREGKTPPVKTKEVVIHRAECLEVDMPHVRFRVACGAGTYIRSLVHSLGMRLGTGAIMTSLTREESRPFTLEQAVSLEALLDDTTLLEQVALPLSECLPHWPRIVLDARQAAQVANGAMLPVEPGLVPDGSTQPGSGMRAMFVDTDGRPLALVETGERNGRLSWTILRGLVSG